MRPRVFPLALAAFLGLVAVVPIMVYYTGDYTVFRSPEDTFIVGLVLPALVFLYISSWIRPGAAHLVLTVFLLIIVMVLAPWFYAFAGMAANYAGIGGLAKLGIQASVTLIILAFALTSGVRRLRQEARV